ncbi:hypothetical protein C0991_004455 [Blastosporella zonata]|nr:hypothetical protein C0991_004455 [Blastosporella zonata]
MPRRPSKTRGSKGKPRPVNRQDAKVTKWNKASDVPMDEEDLFHASRDKVLLEDGSGWQDDDNDEDEVFALNGVGDDEDEDVDMDEQEEEELEDLPTKKKKKAEKSKTKKKKGESSEEEDEEESEEETWGKSKAAWYSSNAAQLESDDEEGNELEEQEAKRLQSKMREDMVDGDFGLADIVDTELIEEDDGLAEPTPVVQTLPQDKKLIIRHLEKTSPETLALARDWEDAIETLASTQEKLHRMESENPDALSLGMIHIYYQALLTYTTTLAFYFHLASSEKFAQRPELLKAHPILRRLLTLKQSLATLEDLDFNASDSEDDEEDEEEDASMTWDEIMADGEAVWDKAGDVGMDEDELEMLLQDASSHESRPQLPEPPKKKRKTLKSANPSPVFDLVEPEFAPSKASSSRIASDSGIADAYGEATSLQHADAADKSARKKSLRFHTSKIESASARRKGARNQAVGGDDDLPYRERKKERDARTTRENTKNRGQGGEDLDDTEPDPRVQQGRDDDDDDVPEGPDGYYELIKKKTKAKKEEKQAEYDAMVEAARPNFDEDAASGPRSLTRAIMANKGLTPHRPKSVRNPRVKKRLKFEKAKKKLSSQKAVFKGGLSESGGRYDGEKSGISKVIKSVRLG